jgi:glycosyltransferase involved in cell wall biosynthesis
MTIAYLANSFPEAVEPYVWDEICELRRRGQTVLPCSIKRLRRPANSQAADETLHVVPLEPGPCKRAIWSCTRNFSVLKEFLARAGAGPEPLHRRLRCVAHTWLGVYLAALLRDRGIQHIHVHHGYFASWVGMVAAKILGAGFSLTLHGSDLLVRADYLDMKLSSSRFCVTVSEFNRNYILRKYPLISPGKILVHHTGVDVSQWRIACSSPNRIEPLILSVGRLHAVKNYDFLIRACRALKDKGYAFRCAIAGEGAQRPSLERLIRELELEGDVTLLGQVPREKLPALYSGAGVVVLTSLSEGIPVTLMEAMAMEKLVLAPAITGIPELIRGGVTGFLYRSNSIDDFVQKVQFLLGVGDSLDRVGRSARKTIEQEFNSALNLRDFAETFIGRLSARQVDDKTASEANEDPILQQI